MMDEDVWFDDDEDEDGDGGFDDCGLMADGQCLKAGSEECDWHCPMRNSEHFAGSAAWKRERNQ